MADLPAAVNAPEKNDDDEKGGLVDKNENIAETDTVVEEVVFGAFRFSKQVFCTSIMPILVIIGLGAALIAIRALYFYSAPEIINHSHTWVVLLNAVRLDFWYIMDELKILVFAIEKALHFISAGRFPHDVPKLKALGFPKMVNASSLRHTLKETSVACHNLKGGWDTLMTYIKSRSSKAVCPVLRAAWPLGVVNSTLHATVSWLSYDANPQANNCAVNDYDPQLSRACLMINSGLIIMELLLPAILLIFLLKHFIRVIQRLVAKILHFVSIVVQRVTSFSLKRRRSPMVSNK